MVLVSCCSGVDVRAVLSTSWRCCWWETNREGWEMFSETTPYPKGENSEVLSVRE